MPVSQRLAAVELDDQLLIDAGVHLLAGGEADDGGLEGLGIEGEPRRWRAKTVLSRLRTAICGEPGFWDLDSSP
jgi:hypothetical protein